MDAETTGSAARERDELLAFELRLDERVCDQVHRLPWGRLFLTPSTPLIWDANWIAIEQVGLSVEQLVAIGDEALGSEGIGHRTIALIDEADGRRVRLEVEEHADRWSRWEVERDRFMAWRDGEAAPGDAREVKLAEIEGLRKELLAETMPADGGGAAAVEQLLDLDRRYGEAAGDRWFVAPARGEPLSACRLMRGGGISQVEEVVTLARARERGYARATVLAAVAAAQEAGDRAIFLVADAADWPQLLYGRLGFETVGEITILRRRP